MLKIALPGTAVPTNMKVCYCNTDLCNGPEASHNQSSHNVSPTDGNGSHGEAAKAGGDESNAASERSVSVVFTVMSLVVTAAQFL